MSRTAVVLSEVVLVIVLLTFGFAPAEGKTDNDCFYILDGQYARINSFVTSSLSI